MTRLSSTRVGPETDPPFLSTPRTRPKLETRTRNCLSASGFRLSDLRVWILGRDDDGDDVPSFLGQERLHFDAGEARLPVHSPKDFLRRQRTGSRTSLFSWPNLLGSRRSPQASH